MNYTEKMKEIIDKMDYETMLGKWRYAPVGDPMFTGEVGDYFTKRMREFQDQKTDVEKVTASKNVGWEG
jgi:zona occludens toxin (predicted ATPase)